MRLADLFPSLPQLTTLSTHIRLLQWHLRLPLSLRVVPPQDRYMYSTIHDRSIALDDRIEAFVNLVQDHYGIGPPEDPASKSSVRLLNPFPFLLLLRHPPVLYYLRRAS